MESSVGKENAPDIRAFVQASDELARLQEEHGIAAQRNLFERLAARYLAHPATDRSRLVDKKRYCLACLLGIFGVHHFYAGHWGKGLAYLLFCWTGIPMGLAVIDWMAAVPKPRDSEGRIRV